MRLSHISCIKLGDLCGACHIAFLHTGIDAEGFRFYGVEAGPGIMPNGEEAEAETRNAVPRRIRLRAVVAATGLFPRPGSVRFLAHSLVYRIRRAWTAGIDAIEVVF